MSKVNPSFKFNQQKRFYEKLCKKEETLALFNCFFAFHDPKYIKRLQRDIGIQRTKTSTVSASQGRNLFSFGKSK